MEDIELAHSLLLREKLNLVIVKEGQVLFSSRGGGLEPFFQAVVRLGDSLHGAAIADKIVGSAVAMLCLYAQIASVYAALASTGALAMLREKGVTITNKNEVPHILNYDGTDFCPFEKLALSANNPSHLFSAMESLYTESRKKS